MFRGAVPYGKRFFSFSYKVGLGQSKTKGPKVLFIEKVVLEPKGGGGRPFVCFLGEGEDPYIVLFRARKTKEAGASVLGKKEEAFLSTESRTPLCTDGRGVFISHEGKENSPHRIENNCSHVLLGKGGEREKKEWPRTASYASKKGGPLTH